MLNTYVLVNPSIQGKIQKSIKAKNSNEAAQLLYSEISQHMNNSLPSFLFTIQKGSSGDGNMYSFQVKEHKISNNNEINYSISKIETKTDVDTIKQFKEKLNEFQNKKNLKNIKNLKKIQIQVLIQVQTQVLMINFIKKPVNIYIIIIYQYIIGGIIHIYIILIVFIYPHFIHI